MVVRTAAILGHVKVQMCGAGSVGVGGVSQSRRAGLARVAAREG